MAGYRRGATTLCHNPVRERSRACRDSTCPLQSACRRYATTRAHPPRQRRCPRDAYCGNGWATIATETLGQVREPLSIDRKNIFFELFVERFFYSIVRHHLFFKYVGTCFRRLDSFDNLAVSTSLSSLKGCDCFLCHSCILFYLISLCTVTRLRIGLYFFNSKRSVVFLRFLVVM